jgi:hypothetical protein
MRNVEEEPLTWVSFRDVHWLANNGPLTATNVLDYVALSQFWDRTCNNAALAMQMRYQQASLGAEGGGESVEGRLSRMVGLEYVVVEHDDAAHNSLFVIHKRRRQSPTQTQLLVVLYVVQGNVYQAPSLADVVRFRVRAFAALLDQSYRALLHGGDVVEGGRRRRREHLLDDQVMRDVTAMNQLFLQALSSINCD